MCTGATVGLLVRRRVDGTGVGRIEGLLVWRNGGGEEGNEEGTKEGINDGTNDG